jgi:hypothetical protein
MTPPDDGPDDGPGQTGRVGAAGPQTAPSLAASSTNPDIRTAADVAVPRLVWALRDPDNWGKLARGRGYWDPSRERPRVPTIDESTID